MMRDEGERRERMSCLATLPLSRVFGWSAGRLARWVVGWAGGWMDGWLDGGLAGKSSHGPQGHLPQCTHPRERERERETATHLMHPPTQCTHPKERERDSHPLNAPTHPMHLFTHIDIHIHIHIQYRLYIVTRT